MDLSKVSDTLNHNLLHTKLNAYGFSFSAKNLYKAIFGTIAKGRYK